MASGSDPAHEQLVARAAAGDTPSVGRLLEHHLPQLRAFVRLQMAPALRLRESGSDVVQSVCRELLEKELRGFDYRGEAAFQRWLCIAARNKIRKRANWHRAHPGPPAASVDSSYSRYCASVFAPSRMAMGLEASAAIEAAFDELPQHYREVISMARVAGLSHAEIGATTGRGEVAARQLLHRALAALTVELARRGLLTGG